MGDRKPRLAAFFRTSSNGQEREDTIRRQFDNFQSAWEQQLSERYELVPRFSNSRSTDPAQIHFADDGYNLEEWDKTTAFHDLMSRCQMREIDVIWMSEIDRIGRSRSNELRGKIQDILQRSEVKVLTKNGEIPSGILFSLLSSIGAEDKRAIMLKCQEGKITRAERDGRPPSGKIPFGYHFKKSTNMWTVVPEEARMIRSMAALMTGKILPDIPPSIHAVVHAHPQGLPDVQLVDVLNAAGFSLIEYYDRNGFGRYLKKNPTGKIKKSFMDNLIRDDRYRGSYEICLREPKQVGHPDFKGMDRDKKRKIILNLPRILPDEIWPELRQKRASRQNRSRRNVRHEYLIRNILICDECGIPMAARPKWSEKKDGTAKPILYYVCTRKKKIDGYQCGARRCHSSPAVDALVFSEIRSVVLSEKTLAAFQTSETSLVPTPSISEFEWSLHEQQKQLKGLKEERARAATNLSKDLLSEEDFLIEKRRIEEESKNTSKIIDKLERKIKTLRVANEKSPEIDLKALRKEIAPKIDRLSFDQRKEVASTLIHQVRIKASGEIEILLRPISVGADK